jgi:hypothetical protein
MDAKIPTNHSLRPRKTRTWFAPLKFRRTAFQKLSQSIDESLAQLEARYPSPLPPSVADRRAQLFDRPSR